MTQSNPRESGKTESEDVEFKPIGLDDQLTVHRGTAISD